MGHHDEAVDLLEQALPIFERRLGAMHHEVGVTLGCLGTVDVQRGDLRSGERRLRRALAIKERTLGTDHPELVPTLGTLSSVCRRNGSYEDARKLSRRAIDLLDRRARRASTPNRPHGPARQTGRAVRPRRRGEARGDAVPLSQMNRVGQQPEPAADARLDAVRAWSIEVEVEALAVCRAPR